ncbi:hypothetical protein [Pseudomonas palmensis]|uniref:hypothetical protein n=1 Tax=Pseudomonas palmensis TaxID=2815362 RepID=UPI003CF732DE
MSNGDQRYHAYQLLRELDMLTSSIMNQVAYGRVGGPLWEEALLLQQQAFLDWLTYADTLIFSVDQVSSLDASKDRGVESQE